MKKSDEIELIERIKWSIEENFRINFWDNCFDDINFEVYDRILEYEYDKEYEKNEKIYFIDYLFEKYDLLYKKINEHYNSEKQYTKMDIAYINHICNPFGIFGLPGGVTFRIVSNPNTLLAKKVDAIYKNGEQDLLFVHNDILDIATMNYDIYKFYLNGEYGFDVNIDMAKKILMYIVKLGKKIDNTYHYPQNVEELYSEVSNELIKFYNLAIINEKDILYAKNCFLKTHWLHKIGENLQVK